MGSRASVIIQRPIDEVFRLTTEHVPEWSNVVAEDEIIEDKGGVGTTFRTVTADRGRRMQFQGIITEHEPPNKTSIHMVGDQFDIQVKYKFTDLGAEGTRVLQGPKVSGKGMAGFFFKFFGWLMRSASCQAAQREMDSLKAFCERSAVDDDGL